MQKLEMGLLKYREKLCASITKADGVNLENIKTKAPYCNVYFLDKYHGTE